MPCLLHLDDDPSPNKPLCKLHRLMTLLPTPHQCSIRNVTEGNGKSNTEHILPCCQLLAGCLPISHPKNKLPVEAIKGKVLIQAHTLAVCSWQFTYHLCLSFLICKTGIIKSIYLKEIL